MTLTCDGADTNNKCCSMDGMRGEESYKYVEKKQTQANEVNKNENR